MIPERLEAGTAEYDRWNARRYELIKRKNRGGLTAEETVEYEALQRLVLEAVERVHPSPPLLLSDERIQEILHYATRKPSRAMGLYCWRLGEPLGHNTLIPQVFNRLVGGAGTDLAVCYATEADAVAAFQEAWRAWKASEAEGQ